MRGVLFVGKGEPTTSHAAGPPPLKRADNRGGGLLVVGALRFLADLAEACAIMLQPYEHMVVFLRRICYACFGAVHTAGGQILPQSGGVRPMNEFNVTLLLLILLLVLIKKD